MRFTYPSPICKKETIAMISGLPVNKTMKRLAELVLGRWVGVTAVVVVTVEKPEKKNESVAYLVVPLVSVREGLADLWYLVGRHLGAACDIDRCSLCFLLPLQHRIHERLHP